MEDPWGSSWENHDVEHSNARPIAASVDVHPEPPPPAFFSGSTNIIVPASQSVWVEDDPLDAWAGAEHPQPSAVPGCDIWGGTGSPSDFSQLTPGHEPKSKASSRRWPRSRSISPCHPLSRPTNRSSDRLSLDPWASDPSTNTANQRGGLETSAPLPQIQHLPVLPINSGLHTERPVAQSRTSSAAKDRPPPIHFTEKKRGHPDAPKIDQPLAKSDLRLGALDTPPESSVPEVDRTHGTLHEAPSPTPVDDVMANGTGEGQRSKVHQLVEMFDGIARKRAAVHGPSPTPRQCATQDHSATVESPGGGSSIHPDLGNALPSIATAEPDPLNTELPASSDQDIRTETEGHSPNAVAETTRIKHKAFSVDYSHLEKLFPGLESKVTGSDVVIPDHIVTDSFESISERKMWYRISRFGPSRKHDLGDDDHFTLITWPTSTVRPETIQIVRRWMEEDSISGRTFRGNLANGANGRSFGWGQRTSPVDLQKFFGRKKSISAGCPTSQSTLPLDGPHSSLSTYSPDRSPVSTPTSTRNMDDLSYAASSGAPPSQHGSAPPGLSAIPRSGDLAFPSPYSHDPVSNAIGQTEVDDDEWGDMVTPSTIELPSSPATNDRSVAGQNLPEHLFNGHEHKTDVDPSVLMANKPSCTDSINQLSRIIVQHPPQGTKTDTKPTSHHDLKLSGDAIHSAQPPSFHMEPNPQNLVKPLAECTREISARQIIESLPDLSYMLQ